VRFQRRESTKVRLVDKAAKSSWCGLEGGNERGCLYRKLHWVSVGKKRVLSGIEGRLDVDKLMAGDSGDKTH
jgi:hypothetical protein